MNRPSAVLAAALAVLLPSQPALACMHGARTVAVATGSLQGNVREEKLVARLSGGSNVAVKLFVAGPDAQIQPLELSPEVLARHEELARRANGILQDEAPRTRGLGATRGFNPQAVGELTTDNGVVVRVERLGGASWSDIVSHLKFPDDPSISAAMDVWTRKVAASGRAIYAARVDLSNAAAGARETALGLGVRISYRANGDRLLQEIATDKWLEYLGSPRVAVMTATPFTEDQLVRAFTVIASGDSVLTGGLAPENKARGGFVANQGGNGRDLAVVGLPERSQGLITITVKGGDIFFKNNSLMMTDRMLQQPLASAGAAPAGQATRGVRGLPNDIRVQSPFQE